MNRLTVLAGLLVILASCTAQGNEVDSGAPPKNLQGDAVATVIFVQDVAKECERLGLKHIPGTEVQACTARSPQGSTIIVKNPCVDKGYQYQTTLCHELGHVNGWPGDHPKTYAPTTPFTESQKLLRRI